VYCAKEKGGARRAIVRDLVVEDLGASAALVSLKNSNGTYILGAEEEGRR